jgi:hypothetical protein
MSESAEIAARFGEQARTGLAAYLNNYRSQLLACLATGFPIVRAWIGDAAFDDAAAKHIDRVPPHAWTLDAYGQDFPETLDALFPEDPEIGELARLERDLALAFVGCDAAPLDPAALTDITTNVGAIWSAINAEQTPPPAVHLPAPASIAIWRKHFAPTFRTVMAEEVVILEQAREGLRFGAICADLIERVGRERGSEIASSILCQWLTDGVLARISG